MWLSAYVCVRDLCVRAHVCVPQMPEEKDLSVGNLCVITHGVLVRLATSVHVRRLCVYADMRLPFFSRAEIR